MSATFLAGAVALSWYAGFSQASLLLGYLVVLLAVFLRVEDLRSQMRPPWTRTVWVGCGLGVGALLAAIQVLPALEAAGYSSRAPGTWEQMRDHAMPLVQMLDFVLPGQMAAPGDLCPEGPENWKPSFLALWLTPFGQYKQLADGVFNHTETAIGFGLWPLLFAISTIPMLFRRFDEGAPRSVVGFLWTVSLIGVLAATAFPGIARALVVLPGMAVGDLKRLLMLPAIGLPCLAAIGWRELRARDVVRMTVPAGISLVCGICLLAVSDDSFARLAGSWIAPGYGFMADDFVFALRSGEAGANRHLLGQGLIVLGCVVALPSALLRFSAIRSWTFVVVTIVELLPIAWQVSPGPELTALSRPLPLALPDAGKRPIRMLRLELGTPKGRLLPLNLPLAWGVGTATGYAPIPAARTEAFFEVLEPGTPRPGTGVPSLQHAASVESPLVGLLAADVLLTDTDKTPLGWKRFSEASGTYTCVPEAAVQFVRLYTEFSVLPRDEVAAALRDREFAPDRTVLLESAPGFESRASASDADRGVVKLVSFRPGELRIHCKAPSQAILFVSQAWAPGWRYEWTDGTRGESQPADLMFQAVPVPAGDNELTLIYDPFPFRIATILSLLGFVILAVGGWLAVRSSATTRSA